MANHPNRNRVGRPRLAPEVRRRSIHVWMAPDLLDALPRPGNGRSAAIEKILRAALLPS